MLAISDIIISMYTVCYVALHAHTHHTGFWPFNSCIQLCKYLFRKCRTTVFVECNQQQSLCNEELFRWIQGNVLQHTRLFINTSFSTHFQKKHFTLQFTYAKSQRPKIKDLGWYALNENVPIRMVIVALRICSMCHCAHSYVCIVDKTEKKCFLFEIAKFNTINKKIPVKWT